MEYHKITSLYERDKRTLKFKEPLVLANSLYGIINDWIWTEKVDGMNIRVYWEPSVMLTPVDNGPGMPEYSKESLGIDGRSNEAQIPSELMDNMIKLLDKDRFRACFPKVKVTIYGEGYGRGTAKGGGNYGDPKFIVFDVNINGFWLGANNVRDVATKLGLESVLKVLHGSLADATELVRNGFKSNLGNCRAEGLVGRTIEPLFDKQGRRLICKIKTRDFE